MEEIIQELNRLADNAYCNYIAQSRLGPCLGVEIKLRKGLFGDVELQAHKAAERQLGRHQALHDAIRLLRSQSAGCLQSSEDPAG